MTHGVVNRRWATLSAVKLLLLLLVLSTAPSGAAGIRRRRGNRQANTPGIRPHARSGPDHGNHSVAGEEGPEARRPDEQAARPDVVRPASGSHSYPYPYPHQARHRPLPSKAPIITHRHDNRTTETTNSTHIEPDPGDSSQQSWSFVTHASETVVKDLRDRLAEPVHRRCALVSNSGGLLGSGHGPEIDRHDAVIRVNFPKVADFEGDVGSRTTLVFSSKTLATRVVTQDYYVNEFPDVPVLMKSTCHREMRNASQCAGAKAYAIRLCDERRQATRWRECRVESDRAMFYRDTSWGYFGLGKVASTGWAAVHNAQELCEETTLYGFGGQLVHGHYWRLRHRDALHKHSFDKEQQMMAKLAELVGRMTIAPMKAAASDGR